MKRDFLKELGKRPLVFDGATGTMLQRLGLKPGGCPDELVLKEPSLVKKVHSAYKDAGADVVSTNTFGANRVKLKEYGLESKVGDINTQAARLARQAVGDGVLVAGDIGPTGHFMEPVGALPFDEAVEIFSEQAISLKAGGADLIVIETMMDLREMKAALMAAKSVGLPVVATMTFDETMRTVLGTSPEAFVVTAEGLGADAAGANCSLGVEGIYRALLAMSRVSSIPLMAQPNAGIPALKGADTVFPASPDDMAAYAQRLAEAGVRILGGCCGTTPEHISRMARAFKPLRPRENAMPSAYTKLSSRTRAVVFGGGLSPVVVGERINPTGRKTLAEEIRQGKTSMIRAEAREQEAAGADALDVNVGVPGIDEPPAMKRAVFAVNENSTLPVVIDSSSPEAVEEGLKAVDGKALINSISGEEKKLREILPLARKYGAALLALALDDAGIPQTAEGRLRAAEAILKRCLDAGIRKEDILVDCLAMTVSAEPNGAVETLKAIRLVKERLGLSTALGVSNISFGLPCREAVNSSFLSMAVGAGLDVAIINPKNKAMADAFFAARLLSAKDAKAEKYIRRFSATGAAGLTPDKPAKPEETVDGRLKKAVIEGDCENIVALVQEALDLSRRVARHLLDVEAIEGGAEVLALAQDGEPAEAALEPLEGDLLEEAAVIAHVRSQIANFKVPKRVVFVDDLPRNAMGKVQKNVLRDQLKG